jgi:hypothetical protein
MYGEEAKQRQTKGRPIQPKREELPADLPERRSNESSERAAKKAGSRRCRRKGREC